MKQDKEKHKVGREFGLAVDAQSPEIKRKVFVIITNSFRNELAYDVVWKVRPQRTLTFM